MIKKIGGFFEAHVEKVVLIIVGFLCIWLFVTRVFLTPNAVEYNGKTYSPGKLDKQLYDDVLDKSRENVPSVIELAPSDERDYSEVFSNPLGHIDFEFPFRPFEQKLLAGTEFPTPDINKIRIANPQIELIRSVVYEPVEEITKSNLYQESDCEPNDLDFVTVSGVLDIKSIVEELRKCYEQGVDKDLVDPCNLKPIFSQVNLQRQQLLPNGQWSDWENVKRPKIDHNKNVFKYVDSYSDLLFGVEIYEFQLNDTLTQLQLLQPEPYQIASANNEWLPPELHRDYLVAQRKDEMEEKKSQRQDARDSGSTRDRGGRSREGSMGTSTNTRDRRSGGGRTENSNNTGRGRSRNSNNPTEPTYGESGSSEESNVNKVYEEFESMILTTDDDITKRSEPVLIWAHDDTVKPENTYRYRLRVGLLNPTAENEDDKLIFWTSFSNITDTVYVPGKIYFFAGEVQEAAKTVSVSVYKLHLGYWYKKVFDRVAQGEVIGGIAEVEQKKPDTDDDKTNDSDDEMVTVDFTTGAIMVDVVPVTEVAEGSSTDSVPYYDMLYTYDNKEILHMPATKRPDSKIWPQGLYKQYRDLQDYINDKYEELKSKDSSEINIEDIRGGQSYNRGYMM